MELIQSPHRILAVDPGKSGAVCLLGGGVFQVRRDFKTLPAIARGIRDVLLFGQPTHVVMENVHAMPGQGVCSMFSFGRSAGVADGALEVLLPGIEVEYVTPQKWQNFYRAEFQIPRETQFDSKTLAGSVLPEALPFLKRVLDHNTGDAILMAVWKILNAGT